MSLFGETQPPRWQSGYESVVESEARGRQQAATFTNAFQNAFSQANSERQQKEKVADERAYKDYQEQKLVSELTPVAEAFKGVDSYDAVQKVKEAHPEWWMNPSTGPFVQKYENTWLQADVTKATAQWRQSQSLGAKIALKDTEDFIKGLASIDPESRAQIKSMAPNKDGTASAQQIQALGLAQQRIQLQEDNKREALRQQQKASGAEATITITPKGITEKYEPISSKAGSASSVAFLHLQNERKKAYDAGNKREGDELTARINKLSGLDSAGQEKEYRQILTSQIKSIDRELLKPASNSDPTSSDFRSIMERRKQLFDKQAEAYAELDRLNQSPSTGTRVAPGTSIKTTTVTTPTPKALTPDVATDFLDKANGNRKEAEKMARDAGYTW